MPADSAVITKPSPTVRSRITNGSSCFLGKVDGRSALARRQRDLQHAYAEDLGNDLTAAQRVRVAQVAALTVRAEMLQAAIANGEPVVDEDLVRVSNALRRELADLGLKGSRASAAPVEPDADGPGARILALLRRDREDSSNEA
ncbi:hypothetical protein [Sinorhizobium fredii]|uniref:hypothetical protein n=2 Tax=Rhizobium fredii TaxID=380 RepID=UPI0035182559